MGFARALDYFLWTLKDLGFYPLLLVISLSLWFAAKDLVDRLTTGIFALSVVFAFLWSLWFLQVLATVIAGQAIDWERSGEMLMMMTAATTLFLFSGVTSSVAVAANTSVRWPMTTLYALIFAHAFHVAALMMLTIRWIDPAR